MRLAARALHSARHLLRRQGVGGADGVRVSLWRLLVVRRLADNGCLPLPLREMVPFSAACRSYGGSSHHWRISRERHSSGVGRGKAAVLQVDQLAPAEAARLDAEARKFADQRRDT